MTTNKVSLRPLGMVAAGATEQAALRNLMRLKSTEMGTATAAMFGVDMEGDKVGHFLVSTATCGQPFSPMTGEMSPRKFRMGATADAVARVLSFFGATDNVRLQSAFAADNDTSQRMFLATCSTCNHVSASDSKVLLRHCTLCGDGLNQDDEGEADVGLTIDDDEGDGEDDGSQQPSSEGSEGEGTGQDGADGADGQDGVDGADGADGVDGADGADGQDAGDGSELDGQEGAPADENLGVDTPQEVPMVSEEPGTDSDQVDPDADTGTEGDDAESRAAATARQHRATQQAIAAAQQARASGEGAGSDDGSDDRQDGDDGSTGTEGDGEGDEASPETAAAKGKGCASAALTEDSVITVNALDDVVAADSTPGNCNTQLVYIPSAAHASQHQWMALVNNVPAATVTAAQAAQANPSLASKFSEPAFASGVLALCSEAGIQAGLKQLGFQSVAFDLPIKNIVEARVAAVEAQADATASDAVAEVAEGIRAALSTSWIAHAKNFFTEDSNELKGSIFDALAASGVLNPAEVTESVFQESGEAFGRSLISRAFSLMEMDVGARNQITAAIQQANVNIPSVANVSMASVVADQLTELGTSTAGVKAGSKEMQQAQHIRNTVQSLHLKK